MDINGQIKVSPTFENVIIEFDYNIGKSEYRFTVRLNRYTVTDVPQTFDIAKTSRIYTVDFTYISVGLTSKWDFYDMTGRSYVKKVVSTFQSLNTGNYLTYRQDHNDTVDLTLLGMVSNLLGNTHKKLSLEDQIRITYQLHEIVTTLERDWSLKNASCKDLAINYDADVIEQLEDRVVKGSNVNKVSQRVGPNNWIKIRLNELKRFYNIQKG